MNSVLALVLVTGAGAAYASVNSSSSSSSKTAARTATVERGTVLATVSGSGSLTSPTDAGVNFTTGGTLTEVDVTPGQKVSAGQVLGKVDPTSAKETLSAAQATLTSAQANLTAVEDGDSSTNSGGSGGGGNSTSGSNVNDSTGGSGGSRSGSTGGVTPTASSSPKPTPTHTPTSTAKPSPSATTSAPTKGTSVVDADYVQAAGATATVNPAQLASAEQQVTSAQNAVDAAQRAVDGTVLKAPVGGTVASVTGKVGDTVSGTSSSGGSGGGSSSSSSSSSSTLSGFVVITNPTGMEVSADFSEADALKLKAGQAATVTLNAQSSTVLNAKLLSISSLPVSSSSGSGGGGSSSSAVQYAALLAITSDTSSLRTGLSASVQVVTGSATNALFVPTAAVTGTGAASSVTVVAADGTTKRQTVTVGVEGDTDVQITNGVTEGEKVQLTVVASTGSGGFPAGGFPGGFSRTAGGGGAARGGFGGGGRG